MANSAEIGFLVTFDVPVVFVLVVDEAVFAGVLAVEDVGIATLVAIAVQIVFVVKVVAVDGVIVTLVADVVMVVETVVAVKIAGIQSVVLVRHCVGHKTSPAARIVCLASHAVAGMTVLVMAVIYGPVHWKNADRSRFLDYL